jgi:hypothetical protein
MTYIHVEKENLTLINSGANGDQGVNETQKSMIRKKGREKKKRRDPSPFFQLSHGHACLQIDGSIGDCVWYYRKGVTRERKKEIRKERASVQYRARKSVAGWGIE